MKPQAPAIRAEALGKSFASRRVLHDLDLEVSRGECLGILGGNGAGKSTLLRLLAGVSRPATGRVSLFGTDSLDDEGRKVRGRIGFVGHEPMLYRDLSPRENLEVFARLYRLDTVDTNASLAQVGLERVGKRATRTLSRGMLQRLALARAMLHQPELLLLDEPFTGLDDQASVLLRDLLVSHRERGGTTVMISHALSEVAAICNRVGILKAGKFAVAIDPVPDATELRALYRRALDGDPS